MAFSVRLEGLEKRFGRGAREVHAVRDLSIEIVNSLTPDQRRELSKNLLDVAKDFDELALDAPPAAPPGACLISC